MYDLRYRKPKTLVPRHLGFEVEERMDFQGEVLTPFNREEASEVARRIREQRVEAVAVCFLHSYANPDHELAMGEILRRDHPEAVVTLRCRTPGTFDYICLVHGPLMTGTITVSAALPSVGGFAPTLLMGVMAGLIGLGMVAGGRLLVARRDRTI